MTRLISNIETDLKAAVEQREDLNVKLNGIHDLVAELSEELEQAKRPADYLVVSAFGRVYYVLDARPTLRGIEGKYIVLRNSDGASPLQSPSCYEGEFFTNDAERYTRVERIER